MFKTFVFRLPEPGPTPSAGSHAGDVPSLLQRSLLRHRKDAYEIRGVSITKTEQLRKVKVEKDTGSYAADIHSHLLQNIVADLDKAFQAFFRRVKAGEAPGHPWL